MTVSKFKSKYFMLKNIYLFQELYIIIENYDVLTEEDKIYIQNMKNEIFVLKKRNLSFLNSIIEEFEIEEVELYDLKNETFELSELILGQSYIENSIIDLLLKIKKKKEIKEDSELKNCYNLFDKELFLKGIVLYKKFLEV